ncbi:hypothetical protein FIBSPDRAFT_856308 [Athelia psychrophila]|uniref:DUF6699 domain-containing protein n=1 Tax=Athelia psychrophila TaxID=1759441 RepID=A0A166NFM4_9AGAM|nr:hypothetical protein FIBSPDRAFT_856308 [Fibularhizoctonia sp. CBS 109695]
MHLHDITVNDQIAFTSPTTSRIPSCPLIWDLRDPPSTAAQLVPSHTRTSTSISATPRPRTRLPSEPATSPPVSALHIKCGLFSANRWRMSAHNARGVTVSDVLCTIHATVHVPLTKAEWAAMSDKQHARVKRAYDARWQGAKHPERERAEGLRRVDALLGCTRFGGLIMSFEKDFECVLSLTRSSMG